jgi:hypothetical protein
MGGDACCVVVRLLACSHSRSAVRYNLHSGVLCECCMVYGRRAASVGADGSVHVTHVTCVSAGDVQGECRAPPSRRYAVATGFKVV